MPAEAPSRFGPRDRAVALARRTANGAVAAILRSRAHRLLSGRLLLLTYAGRRTGRRFTLPLMYARDGGDLLLVALHPEGQTWWRNLRDGAEVELLLAAERLGGLARIAGDQQAARRAYAARHRWAAPLLRAAKGSLFVRVTPRRRTAKG